MTKTHTHSFRAALFDLDGVIIDTEGLYTQIWADIERHFPTGIDDFAHKIKGSTLERILSTWFPCEQTQNEIVRMLTQAESTMQYRLFDGVEQFLQALRAQGIPAAIVTSSNPTKMKRLFESLPTLPAYFDTVITDNDVTHSKPAPDCYLLGAQRLGIPIEDCIVFEDSFSGLKAGGDSGAKVVALATTNSRESLEGCADTVIDSFADLTPQALTTSLFA